MDLCAVKLTCVFISLAEDITWFTMLIGPSEQEIATSLDLLADICSKEVKNASIKNLGPFKSVTFLGDH